jgi:hypothetical protein
MGNIRNPGLIKNRISGAAINPYRFVAFGADDDHVIQANGSLVDGIGASMELGVDGAGQRLDIALDGIVEVEFGDTIVRGQKVTADANGKAIPLVAEYSLKKTVIAGGAAGDLAVAGILTTDTLVAVIRLDRDATAANVNISDVTAEFSITAADTINNAAGTNTTGDSLLVLYSRVQKCHGRAMQSGVASDVGSVSLDR